jgi:hypothetical protein
MHFFKKIENLEYAIALHFTYYSFCRSYKMLNPKAVGITPAVAAGVSDNGWTLEDIIYLADLN